MIGDSVRRLEDQPLLRGRGRYVADLIQRGDLHMRVVRSEVAHARLRRVVTDGLRDAPGVALVLTALDLPPSLPKIATRMVGAREMLPYLQPVLARDRVRYVGEPVAAVFASDPYVAEDACEAVTVELEELPVELDACAAAFTWGDDGSGSEVVALVEDYGGVDEAFAGAHAVVELELTIGRHSGVPLETRGARAHLDQDTGILVVEGAAKVPHYNRDALATMLGLRRDMIVLREGHVGGGFGVRGELYPEDVLVALGALRTGRAVSWIEDRGEHLVATNQSRQQVHRIRAAVDAGGFVLAIDDEFWLDQGAYVRTHGATVPTLSLTMLPGPYRIPAYRARGHVRLTHKTPAGTYRAPGRYETTFVRERLVDAVAARLGLDRVAVRRTNFIAREEMPYRRPMSVLGTEVVYDSGDYALLLDRLLEHSDHQTMVEDVAARRAAGEHVGLGIAAFVEKSGLGPYEGAQMSVDSDGTVRVVTGVASLGQGVETAVAQIVADALGTDYRKVHVSHGQTDELAHGFGAFATRATVMAGSAAHRAALAVREKAIETAAELLEASSADLEIVDGAVCVRGTPARSVPLGAVAAALEPSGAPAARHDTGAGGRVVVRSDAHDVSVRHPPCRRPCRPRDRRRRGPALRGRLRHRPRRQPHARRRADLRRCRAGTRRGAAGGVPVRRPRPATGDIVHGLPLADRRRRAGDRRAPHRGRPVAAEPARCEGRRRGRDHRRRRRDRQRRRRRPRPSRRDPSPPDHPRRRPRPRPWRRERF